MSLRHAQDLVFDWNRTVEVGDEVLLTKRDGSKLATRTAGPAWLMGGTTPAVQLEGIDGACRLDDVARRQLPIK
jgi:hypothetical protein